MFACMAQVLKFPIHACVVYARLQKMIDEMKTSMHRMVVRCALHVLQVVQESCL
jgi:hypothetical protein